MGSRTRRAKELEERKKKEEEERRKKDGDERKKGREDDGNMSDDIIEDPDENEDDSEQVKSAHQLAKEEAQRMQTLLNAKYVHRRRLLTTVYDTDIPPRAQDVLKARAGLAMEHCKLNEWQETASFFGIEVENLQKGESLSLPRAWGLTIPFTPYQLTEAYILYKKERSNDNGGIFANMMGMGKTRAMLLMLLIGHVHWLNWQDVTRARANGDRSRHRAVQDGREPCPTANERTFHCACEAYPSMPEKPRTCPTMVSGWGRAVDAWKKEVVYMGLNKSKWCKPSDPLALRLCFMDDTHPPDMGPPTRAEEVEMRIDPNVDVHLANHNRNVLPREYTLNGEKLTETITWSVVDKGMPEVYPEATKDCPAPSAGRFIIICGHTTLQRRVLNRYNSMHVKIHRTVTKKGVGSVESMSIPIPGHVTLWGRIVFDEFHNCKSEDTIIGTLYRDLRQHNRGYQWKAWALSGTPMEKGMHEILIFVSLALVGLEASDGISNWYEPYGKPDANDCYNYRIQDEVYTSIAKNTTSQNRGKKMIAGLAMARRWANVISKAKDGIENVTKSEEYKELMEIGIKISARFMLRRTLVTQDPWGKKISGIKGDFLTWFRPCALDDYESLVDDATQRCRTVLMQEGLDVQEANETMIFNCSEMQAIASYLLLAILKAQGYEKNGSKNTKRLVSDNIQQFFATPDNNLIAWNITDIAKHSKKYWALEQECKRVSATKTPNPHWSQAADSEARKKGKPRPPKTMSAKILIGSYKPLVQLVTWLALRKKYGKDKVLLLKGGMKKSLVEEVQEKWRDPTGPFIIVASMAFAEAITLIEASTVVIMEPQDRQNTQDQFMFRVYRLGQLADICSGMILYNPASDLEVGVLSKQFVKTASRDGLQGEQVEGEIKDGQEIEWDTTSDIVMKLEGLY